MKEKSHSNGSLQTLIEQNEDSSSPLEVSKKNLHQFDIESITSRHSHDSNRINLKKVKKRVTRDDFEYESPVKAKLPRKERGTLFFGKDDQSVKSEDDSPDKQYHCSPTKKKLVSDNFLPLAVEEDEEVQ